MVLRSLGVFLAGAVVQGKQITTANCHLGEERVYRAGLEEVLA